MTVYRALIQRALTNSSRVSEAVGRRAASAGRGRQTRFTKSSQGQTLVEYGLLIALIAVIVIVALLFLGPIVSGLFRNIGNTIQGT